MRERKAVIEVGTNSVKYCLAEVSGEGAFRVLKDVNEIARLGEGLRETGRIASGALERNAQVVAAFAEEARGEGAETIALMGTMALRSAANADDFIGRVRERTGFSLIVLSGDEEAKLSYDAAVSGIPGADVADLLVFDTGGGSTEFVYGRSGAIDRRFSLDVGSLRITELYLTPTPVPPERLNEARAAIRRELADGGVTGPVELLVGMGGNVTSLVSVKLGMAVYDRDAIQGAVLALDEVRRQVAAYASQTMEERRRTVGLVPQRADVILAGACIVEAIMELCGRDRCSVSDRGIRHGMMARLFQGRS